MKKKLVRSGWALLITTSSCLVFYLTGLPALALTQQTGSVGIEGTVPTNPPTQAPTITVPKTGQTFSSTPINIAGLCQNGLLVEIFKNGVFAGSVVCAGNGYSLKIDLFSGRNDLVARQYDALNQPSPDSNIVTVTFNDSLTQAGPRLSITTQYAKRGANPGDQLSWPLTISGGTGPYAVSIDWGDKTGSQLISRSAAGDFTTTHTYSQSGIFNVLIRVGDEAGQAAFLQVVAISNGPIQQNKAAATATTANTRASKWLFIGTITIAIPIVILSFWLGKKHQLQKIRARLRRGDRPF